MYKEKHRANLKYTFIGHQCHRQNLSVLSTLSLNFKLLKLTNFYSNPYLLQFSLTQQLLKNVGNKSAQLTNFSKHRLSLRAPIKPTVAKKEAIPPKHIRNIEGVKKT